MTAKPDRLVSFDHYFQKTYFKTASLIANSAKAVESFTTSTRPTVNRRESPPLPQESLTTSTQPSLYLLLRLPRVYV